MNSRLPRQKMLPAPLCGVTILTNAKLAKKASAGRVMVGRATLNCTLPQNTQKGKNLRLAAFRSTAMIRVVRPEIQKRN